MSDENVQQERAPESADAVAEATFGPGSVWEGDDDDERRRVIEAAFDYRGDVTIRLEDGREVVGYLSN
ncbi:MAG TPA: hypothetical protein VK116_13065, partial [Planctomycetota bacterium]|nr:hypothetical protein [Planctomycetota bacterium]